MTGSSYPMAKGLMEKEPWPSPCKAGYYAAVRASPGFWAALPQARRPSTAIPRNLTTAMGSAENLGNGVNQSSVTIQTLGGQFAAKKSSNTLRQRHAPIANRYPWYRHNAIRTVRVTEFDTNMDANWRHVCVQTKSVSVVFMLANYRRPSDQRA